MSSARDINDEDISDHTFCCYIATFFFVFLSWFLFFVVVFFVFGSTRVDFSTAVSRQSKMKCLK